MSKKGYTLYTSIRDYWELYRYHRKATEEFAKHAAEEARRLVKFLEGNLKRPIKDLRILEIGCGQRYWGTLTLHSLGAKAVGIDLEPVGPGLRKYLGILRMGSLARLVKTAAREFLFDGTYYRALGRHLGVPLKYSGLKIFQASATDLPFEEGSFDAVISSAVFEHLPDPKSAVSEINRVLDPKGVARVVIHLYPSLSGGHHFEWQDPDIPKRRSLPAWEHVQENSHPAPMYLNRLKKGAYLKLFKERMRVFKTWIRTEGEQYLTPAIVKAAKRNGYTRRDLLEVELRVFATPKKR